MSNIRTTNPQLDTENPLVNKIIDAMRERGRKAKEKDPFRGKAKRDNWQGREEDRRETLKNLLIVFKDGTEKIIKQIEDMDLNSNHNCFFVSKNKALIFIPRENVLYIGLESDLREGISWPRKN